jgi:hypothetical protein
MSSKSICFVKHIDTKHLSRQLNKHEKCFKQKWKKYNTLLGKATINRVFDNMERYFIPRYDIVSIDSTEIWLKPSKEAISDIIFVYENNYLGDYCYGRGSTITHKRIRNIYNNKLNYGIPSGHYLTHQIDKEFLLDFLEKGFQVFSLSNFEKGNDEELHFWFTLDGFNTPIKFKESEVWEKIEKYNNESIYKSKFYKNANN